MSNFDTINKKNKKKRCARPLNIVSNIKYCYIAYDNQYY